MRVEQRTAAQNAERAEAIGDRPGEGLAHAPKQILHRESERENIATPAIGFADRLHEQARSPSAVRR